MTDRDMPDAWWHDESPIGTDRRRERTADGNGRRGNGEVVSHDEWASAGTPGRLPDPRCRPAP